MTVYLLNPSSPLNATKGINNSTYTREKHNPLATELDKQQKSHYKFSQNETVLAKYAHYPKTYLIQIVGLKSV